jgi:methylated-DNA-[protein]-cysteine S-methyltransferase
LLIHFNKMETAYTTYYSSPIGLIKIAGSTEALQEMQFVETKEDYSSESLPPLYEDCKQQLNDYFRGQLKNFSLPLVFAGTAFQQQVWTELSAIPYGRTTSYVALARKLKNPNAVRAIGSTNAKNKLCIVVPCHRVIGNDGTLVGYAGGLWRKQWLLEHERAFTGQRQLTLFQ